jgi:hypothetical protein
MNDNSDRLNELLILQSWRDSSAVIKLRVDDTKFSVELWANVIEASADRLDMRVFPPGGGRVSFDLRGATFRYQDVREAEAGTLAAFSERFVCALTVVLADGLEVLLYESRSDEDLL